MTRLLAILFLTSCLTSTVVAADVDLSQSKITPEAEKVPGGMMLTVNVVLKNTGDKPSDGTDLTIRFPQGSSGVPGRSRTHPKQCPRLTASRRRACFGTRQTLATLRNAHASGWRLNERWPNLPETPDEPFKIGRPTDARSAMCARGQF